MRFAIAILFCATLLAAAPERERAYDLYQRTDYQQSLNLLLPAANKDAGDYLLIGQNYFMLGEYKKATDAFDKALSSGNADSNLCLWAGRAYGRRAETASFFTAPGLASHARKLFEKAVDLDLSNKAAVGDLFDYYLGAPGFLGGGLDKAQALAQRMAGRDPVEGQYLMAQVEEKRKQFDQAEQHLRRAVSMAPHQVSRVLDLARYLARHGRLKESDTLFERAEQMAPANPRVLFYRAETYVHGKRNLQDARTLLERYLAAPLTPDDPPRAQAEALLQQIMPQQIHF
ncbi:MAG TPA: tetratricopeptide repeat protein [Bryobacteraceae bacterium]|nr:tetratricopeptide repeat protein [Bryobacteraceae bacterium]